MGDEKIPAIENPQDDSPAHGAHISDAQPRFPDERFASM